jgi:hypothetical protein
MSIQTLTDAELDAVYGGDSNQVHNNIHVQAIHSSNVEQGVGVANALGHSKAAAAGIVDVDVDVVKHRPH